VRNRMWRFCARTAVAITATAVTLGGAVAIASPATAADLPAVEVTNGEFEIILPGAGAGAQMAQEAVKGSTGFGSLTNVTVESEGFDLEGEINGRLRTYDFRSIWEVYNLSQSSGISVLIPIFSSKSNSTELKETFRREQEVELNLNISFRIKAADMQGVSRLKIGFQILRLEFEGDIKDFMVLNGASGGAQDQDSDFVPIDMDVDFQPI
jgi:hypothetical protein